jgi:hypothetical protein
MGFNCQSVHNPSEIERVIEKVQPSLLTYRTENCSPPVTKRWHELSPNSILMGMDGAYVDRPEKNVLDGDLVVMAKRDVESFARWRDSGFPNLWKLWNEPHIEQGLQYRRRLNEYTTAALSVAPQYDIALAIFNFSVGWPSVSVLDAEDWWGDFASSIQCCGPWDYAVVHEYWSHRGPAFDWPYLAGRHYQYPYDVPLLIGECGIDDATMNHNANEGWKKSGISKADYLAQLAWYASAVSPKVWGIAGFLLDYQNNTWDDFDLLPLCEELKAHDWDKPVPTPELLVSPRFTNPTEGPVTQLFGLTDYARANPGVYAPMPGHNGIDFGAGTGTQVVAVANGTVCAVEQWGNSYGWHVKINHKWGQTIYAHLSRIDVQLQQQVTAGERIGAVGSTGFSTGPHLHFGLRIPGQRNPAYNDWINPAPYLSLGSVLPESPITPEPTVPSGPVVPASAAWIKDARWNAEQAVRDLEQLAKGLELVRARLLDNVAAPLSARE